MVKCNHEACKKKLDLVDLYIKCKCQQCFCKKHRPIENHTCIDLISEVEPLIKCVPKKVIMI